jgi:hypothetical protein
VFIRAGKQIKKALLCQDTILVLVKILYFVTTLTSGILTLVSLKIYIFFIF